MSAYSGWEPEVDQMLSVCPRSFLTRIVLFIVLCQCVEKPTIWAIHVIEDLPYTVHDRVAIMGDAVSRKVLRL